MSQHNNGGYAEMQAARDHLRRADAYLATLEDTQVKHMRSRLKCVLALMDIAVGAQPAPTQRSPIYTQQIGRAKRINVAGFCAPGVVDLTVLPVQESGGINDVIRRPYLSNLTRALPNGVLDDLCK